LAGRKLYIVERTRPDGIQVFIPVAEARSNDNRRVRSSSLYRLDEVTIIAVG
jgi:hypothetical protein